MNRIHSLFRPAQQQDPRHDAEARRLLDVISRCDHRFLAWLLERASAQNASSSEPWPAPAVEPLSGNTVQKFSLADLMERKAEGEL